jgi:CRP/FNR family transcriptional regulator
VVDTIFAECLSRETGQKPGAMNQILLSRAKCWKCENCAINNRAICRAAPKDALEELNRISKIRKYEKGQTIIDQGADAIIVGNVVSGIVKVSNSFEDGSQQIVGLIFPSDFFGRVFDTQSRFSYEAATDVTVCTMARQDFENLLMRHPEIEHELLVTILDELDAMLILSNRDRSHDCRDPEVHGNMIVNLPISRRDIATYLGTTPETLSRNIQLLSRKKVIRILNSRQFEVTDAAKLAEYSGDDNAWDSSEGERMAVLP